MNDEQNKKNVNDTCNESKEDSIWSMARDFYGPKMRSTTIFIWACAIIFVVAAAYFGAKFLQTDQTKSQIMYATLFVCCFNAICLMKVFAWMMIQRIGIKREIKKLKK
ncbi:MAG: hypothetical protein GWN67_05015 [Phycisphaerae bacterium]|nr:hypothetical protein [Phycisphaerae bacterium]NIP51338.1 hypothetical protein [Phycisphaerae bacterium]NIS50532.1 hypothetical protein [Phycisphaerae bacterium]NIU08267.1 hypothetical protein [Phycisphaerae bacterium]NIU55763.1 hypothetical protein [Phycisphaerae bacterium]